MIVVMMVVMVKVCHVDQDNRTIGSNRGLTVSQLSRLRLRIVPFIHLLLATQI